VLPLYFSIERLTHVEDLQHLAAIPIEVMAAMFIVEKFLERREQEKICGSSASRDEVKRFLSPAQWEIKGLVLSRYERSKSQSPVSPSFFNVSGDGLPVSGSHPLTW
jgi:hypothetical protein